MKNRHLPAILLSLMLSACAGSPGEISMFPDYGGVTVPCNIAPLNFHYLRAGARKAVTTFRAGENTLRVRGSEVRIPAGEWEKLKLADTIRVSSNLLGDWAIYVSRDSIDRYLTYRLIEPGYEVWDRVEIRERDLSSFEENTIISWKDTENSCVNCHIHKGRNSMYYIRGPKGAAILNRDGDITRHQLKKDGMISGTVYGDLHPDGRWGVFSSNIIIPGFHTLADRRLEVFDTKSDVCITDFDSGEILTPENLSRADVLETFPCFNGDGTAIFYCAADSVRLPQEIEKLKYSLFKASFNPSDGSTGNPEMIWDAAVHNASVCHPKASPDGKWLLYTVADYGTFPIWHQECDLELMDLTTGTILPLDAANSDRSDTYHSWSSNSRWFVFASKRGDGQYGRPYFCHIDKNGKVTKPFVLPQKDSHLYEKTLKSFNIPDLGLTSSK